VFKTFLIFLIGLIPPLVSVWVMRQAEARARVRLRLVIEEAPLTPLIVPPQPPDQQYVGDITCKFNARSPYLRCAVNPEGPCVGCSHYQYRE